MIRRIALFSAMAAVMLGIAAPTALALPECNVSATAAGGNTGFLILAGYRGVGDGMISCSEPVASSAISVEVEVTPAGADADSRACPVNSTGCSANADAATARAPGNCTFVTAGGGGPGLGLPFATASTCEEINLPQP